jgi:hypothetical protein
MWAGNAEVMLEVGKERDRLKSFAEALLRGLAAATWQLEDAYHLVGENAI